MLRLFIADLHLRAEATDQARLGRFLTRFGAGSELFVLGDLCDLWLGDDIDLPRFAPVVDALAAYAARGGQAHVMVGNHDFLFGEAFFAHSGARPLPDPTVIEHAGHRLLLTHGDTLCTADVDYQAFRTRIRAPQFVADFLAKPPAERVQVARGFQDASRTATAAKAADVMEVDTAAATAALREADADMLLHGHTHRPGVHRLDAGKRVVLGPWYDGESALVWPADGPPQPINMGCNANDLID
ncbi:MAG TPA: UDP-2,3-diacylglucosamine diphosphatase [Gammaproteobacteria bacterium]|uniref:UDP-2,3-diacylglucosamine diphosphatase n=1 Tax=Immundisolibacter sp. TaxID=1934948 RepID=UPI000E865E6C|nr:UDP-2,3-diacylglucosamine diphosphatase [Gammaproteobacteria bacterium]HCZ48155.1 UDP-2,3-diacylglucosamine diphosphatase [Gammaproteobacteria bacterium]MCH77593.1 UDP-2,3-diacylglucosamine diphosphatase [Gammaproteobacteria bacterium]